MRYAILTPFREEPVREGRIKKTVSKHGGFDIPRFSGLRPKISGILPRNACSHVEKETSPGSLSILRFF
jgi:hypothetical protein